MSNFFTDSVVTIKQESTENIMNTSASVPIPSRRDLNDYRTFSGGNSTISNSGITNLDFDNSQSPQYIDSNLLGQVPSPDNTISWSNHIVNSDEMLKSELIHMDDDDIFQVDKADLIQGPTLAELNANEEAYLGDLNFDDLLLPEENSYITLDKNLPMVQLNNSNNNNVNTQLMATSCPTHQNFFFYNRDLLELGSPSSGGSFKTTTPVPAFSPVSQASSNSSLVPTSTTSPLHINTSPSALQQRHSTLHELLLKRENYGSPDRATPMLEQTVGTQHPRQISRLSSSAPTHLGFEQIWQRREPRKHLLSTGSLAEAGSTSSISTGGILSPDPQDFSHDELESDDDSDAHYEDFSSDNGDSDDDDEHSSNNRHSSKKERFFWQYNVQAKGPKGQRLVMKCKMEDPHVLHEVTDPVFSPDCSVRGIKHSGKARKGDGNDLTPNAKKLYTIGKELDKLGRIINDMTPVSELPFNVRPTSRKEKNKLASRACRLKKKAQHEANKIKLNGLESEHKRLINGLIQAKQLLTAKLTEQQKEKQDELSANMDKIVKNCSIKIAGHTTDYVNKILERLKNGAVTQQLGSSAGSDEQL